MAKVPHPTAPHAPSLCLPPLPWCLLLNYISALASTDTLFTHSSIHIHLACTCLVPVRVAHPQHTQQNKHKHTPGHTHMLKLSPEMSRETRRAMEMSGREKEGWWREEIKMFGWEKGAKNKNVQESEMINGRSYVFVICVLLDDLERKLIWWGHTDILHHLVGAPKQKTLKSLGIMYEHLIFLMDSSRLLNVQAAV